MSRCSIEERFALQELMTDYCLRVDDLTDVQPLLELFTEDAVLDFSDIGLPAMHGRAEYKAFYDAVFADMSHHTHYLTNFKVESYTGDSAVTFGYVQGLGRANSGNEVHVHVRYRMKCIKQGGAWKIATYYILQGMPAPASLSEIHGNR